MSEVPCASWKTCDVRRSWTEFKTAETLIANNNPSDSLMRVCEKESNEVLCLEEVRCAGQAEGAGRRVCVCVCVQLLTVSSCRPSVHLPHGKFGGERSLMPRNAVLPGARCTNTTPLFSLQTVSPDGSAVVDAPHTEFHSDVVPVLGTASWGEGGVEEWR